MTEEGSSKSDSVSVEEAKVGSLVPLPENEESTSKGDQSRDAASQQTQVVNEEAKSPTTVGNEKKPERRRALRESRQNSQRSVGSFRSTASSSSARNLQRSLSSSSSSLKRPAGIRDRMQQRVRSSQGERNLAVVDDDDVSIDSRASHQSSMSSAVRDRLSTLRSKVALPSTNSGSGSSDDTLLLQMTQKVRQLEKEKDYLSSRQNELRDEHAKEIEKLKAKIRDSAVTKASAAESSSDSKSSSESAIELQAKLNKAMMRIKRLEEEQARHEDMEDKYQEAQVTIANLQLNSVHQRSIGSLSLGDMTIEIGELNDITADAQSTDIDASQRQGMHSSALPLEALSPRSRSGSVDTSSIVDDASESKTRSDKLRKLKEFRRSRESQLKELVLDNQDSPTDVQSVIRNLQDELKAAKQVMLQQKHILTLSEKEDQLKDTKSEEENNDNNTEGTIWKAKYQVLHEMYVQLEMNRAWGEFQLRDRITTDALKFHRRLRHWKERTEKLQSQLEDSMQRYENETRDLRNQLSKMQEDKVAAEQDLVEYKRGMGQTLKEYSATKDRLTKLTEQVLAARSKERSQDENATELLQQARLLESAMERKDDSSISMWSTSWISKKVREKVASSAAASQSTATTTTADPDIDAMG